jgi:mannose/fructose-specific phosphotransferase system component IIA
MSGGLHGVVVCHGDLARALVDSAEQISGVRGRLVAVTNNGCDRTALEQRIVDAVGGRPAIVFLDMPSGSCVFAAMRRLAALTDVRLVTGVNLAMLLDFILSGDVSVEAAAARAVETGAKAIGKR